MTSDQLPVWFPIVMVLLMIWTIPWKGVALWKAARNNDIAWFVVLMVFNTVGILEILYIYIWSNKKKA